MNLASSSVFPINTPHGSSIEQLSVRLRSGEECLGSGFLVNPSIDSQKAYLLTARHCVAEADLSNGLIIDRYDYPTGTFESVCLTTGAFAVYYFEEERAYDLAVIAVDKQFLFGSVPTIRLRKRPTAQLDYRFRGFPAAFNHQRPEELTGECVLAILGTQSTIHVLTPLEGHTSPDALSNVQGFSGSGLYVERSGEVELVGIVSKFQPFNCFLVCTLCEINELLKQSAEPELDLLEPFSIPVTPPPVFSSTYSDFSKQFLEVAEQQIEELKPGQALTIALTARKDIEDLNLPVDEKNRLLAKTYWLEAQARADLPGKGETDALLIRAHKLAPFVTKYRERAAVAYFRTGEPELAISIAGAVLNENPNSPRAWAVLSELNPDLSVPATVKAEPVYKTLKVSFLGRKNANFHVNELNQFFSDEVRYRKKPKHITRGDLYYWFYLAQYALQDYLHRELGFYSFEQDEKPTNSPRVRYACHLYEALLKQVDETELRNHPQFLLVQFDYCFCQYLLTRNVEAVKQMYALFVGNPNSILPFQSPTPLFKSMPIRAAELVFPLLQVSEPSKVLEVIALLPLPQPPFAQLVKGLAYEQLGQVHESTICFKEYMGGTAAVDELDTQNFWDLSAKLLVANEPAESVVQLATEGKTFALPYAAALLEAHALMGATRHRERVKTLCEEIRAYWDDLPHHFRVGLASIYIAVKDPATARELLAPIVDLTQESNELWIYIQALRQAENDFQELLRLLALWRVQFAPNYQLHRMELDLCSRLRDHVLTEEVAGSGMRHFPKDPSFLLKMIEALHVQEKEAELLPLLNEQLWTLNLTWQGAFWLGAVCIRHGRHAIGLELYYRALKANPGNPEVRDAYFINLTQFAHVNEAPVPEVAEVDMVVCLVSNGQERVIELTPEATRSLPVAKKALGRKQNESFTVEDPTTGILTSYTVEQVLDKYRGQFALLAKDVSDNPDTSAHVRSYKFENLEPEGIENTLRKLFGSGGTQRKIIVDDILARAARGEVGFTELTWSVFADDPLSTWTFLTSKQSSGFLIVSLIKQQPMSLSGETEFVIDYSTLFPLYELSRTQPVKYNGKPFVVSQLMIDYFRVELMEARQERKSFASVIITEDRVVPFLTQEDEHQHRIEYLRGLLEWLEKECRVAFAPERLAGHLSQRQETSGENDQRSIMLDIYLLSKQPNRILISDDLLYHQYPQNIKPVTLELYLKSTSESTLPQNWLFTLVHWNYRGLTLTGQQLYRTFESNKMMLDSHSDFHKALASFAFKHNSNSNNALELIQFLKLLYADELSLEYKQRVSRLALYHLLIGLQFSEKMIHVFVSRLTAAFALLGEHKDHVQEDFYQVVELIQILRSSAQE